MKYIVGTLIIILGVSILFDINLFKLILPLLLIWIGFQIITGKETTREGQDPIETTEDSLKRVQLFSNVNQKIISNSFEGGEFITVGGGGKINLSEVKISDKSFKLELVTILSSVEIKVPKSWQVRSQGFGILGSFDNKATGGQTKKTVEVTIKGVSIFGMVVVTN